MSSRASTAARLALLCAIIYAAGAGCQGKGTEGPVRARVVLGERAKAEVTGALADLPAPVTVAIYRGPDRELGSDEAESLLSFMEQASSNVRTARHGMGNLPERAGFLKPVHGPVLEVQGPLPLAARYLGNPAEMELPPFLDWVRISSGLKPPLSEATAAFLENLSADVGILIFVTPG